MRPNIFLGQFKIEVHHLIKTACSHRICHYIHKRLQSLPLMSDTVFLAVATVVKAGSGSEPG